MRFLRWTLVFLAALALLLIVAGAVLLSIDYGAYKDDLAAWASKRIGRALVVDGALSIEPGRTLRLTANGIRLGNVAWGSRTEMLLARRVLVELDAWSLIDRPVIVHRIEVEDLDLLLERTAEGDNNWEFGGAGDGEDFAWQESLPVVVDRVRMPNARLQFIGPRLARPLDVRFDMLEQQRDSDGMLTFSGTGRANDTELEVTARAGPFDRLVAGRNFAVSLDGHVGELRIESHAQVDSLAKPVNSELSVTLQGADADYLASRLGVRNLGAGPVALAGSIAPAADGRGLKGTLSGRLGAFDIKASGALSNPATMEALAVQLDLSGPDLSLLGGLAGVDRLPVEEFRLQANVERTGELLKIGEVDLTLQDSNLRLQGSVSRVSAMTGTDLEFQVKGSDVARFRQLLNIYGVATGPFEVAGRVRQSDSGAEVIELRSRTTLGELSVSGPLGAYPDYYGSRLRFDAAGPDLDRVGEAFGVADLPAAAFAASGEFEWTRAGVVFRDSTLRAGRDHLTLNGRVGRRPLGRDTDVRLRITGPNLSQLAAALGQRGFPAVAYDLAGRLRRETSASRLDDVRGSIAGADLRLNGRVGDARLKGGTDIDVQITGPALEAFAELSPGYKLPAGRFRAVGGLKLTSEVAVFRNLRFEAGGAEGRVNAELRLPVGVATGRFDIAAKGRDLARLLPALGKVKPLVKSFDLTARGQVRNGRWSFAPMQLTTDAGRIALTGDLDWSPDFSATALRLDVQVEDLAVAGQLLGRKFPAQALTLAADFSGTPTAFQMRRLSGRLGESDFSGRLSLELQKRPRFDVEFRSELLDLAALTGADGQPAVTPEEPPPGKRVIPDTRLSLEWLNRADGTIAVTAARAHIADAAFDNLRLAARLRDGGLYVDPLELQGPLGGRWVVRGDIAPGPAGATAQLSVTGRQAGLSLWSDTPAQAATRPRADLDMQLTAQGRTWRELAGTLGGQLRLVGGAGELPGTALDMLLGKLWRELLATVRRGAAPRATQLQCITLLVNVAGGVATTAPVLAVQTDEVNLITHGWLNLRDETLELFLRTTPRKRIGISAGEIINPYVKVAGPMNRPRLAVDPKGTLFSAGTAVATGGLSIVAQTVWDRMFRASDPCAAALAEADRLAAKRPGKLKSLIPKPLRP